MSKLISRTINEKQYDVMTLNVKTAEVKVDTFSLGSVDFKNKAAALKALQDKFNTADVRLVEIVKVMNNEALYVMSEEAFIKGAIRVKDLKEARAYFKSNPDEVEEVEAE